MGGEMDVRAMKITSTAVYSGPQDPYPDLFVEFDQDEDGNVVDFRVLKQERPRVLFQYEKNKPTTL